MQIWHKGCVIYDQLFTKMSDELNNIIPEDCYIVAVTGKRGIGKSEYCRCKTNRYNDSYYVESQLYDSIPRALRDRIDLHVHMGLK